MKRFEMKSFRHTRVVTVAVLLLAASKLVVAQEEAAFEAKGFQPNRDYFTQQPFEHIDTLSGNLILTFTDLVLPGNAGRDLRFQRTYNSKDTRWTFGLAGMVMGVFDVPWPPVVDDPNFTPDVITADGGSHPTVVLYPDTISPARERWVVSADFSVYDRQERRLYMPDGSICQYAAFSGRLTQCDDPFGNSVTLSWTTAQLTVTQTLERGEQEDDRRVIVQAIASQSGLTYVAESMTYLGRTWTYQDAPRISEAVSPVGLKWRYAYFDPNAEAPLRLSTVTLPQGGEIQYAYRNRVFTTPDGHVFSTIVLRDKTLGGREIPAAAAGSWHYEYDMEGPSDLSMRTTITSASGVTTTYQYGQMTDQPTTCPLNAPSGLGVRTRTVSDGTGDLESETREYTNVATPGFSCSGGMPELSSRTIVRGGPPYRTTFEFDDADHYGNYHRPTTITETGELTRTTTRTYDYDFNLDPTQGGPYFNGKLQQEKVKVNGGDEFTRSWTYHHVTGFTESETTYGITSTFTPAPGGNVATTTDGNGKTTSFSYRYGVVSEIATPKYPITRVINEDGTVATETRRGKTTTFEYDNLSRPTVTQPAGGGEPIRTTYDDAGGATVRVSRGTVPGQPGVPLTFTKTTFDGLGRPIGTENAQRVRTSTRYDQNGRKSFESYPFEATEKGTVIEYDGLGRVTRRTHPDGKTVTTTYGAGTVTIRDEKDRTTTQQWEAFGDPADARLVAVIDAAEKRWTYDYHPLGQLATVTAPDGLQRTWEYDARNLLIRETHPESGTTTYDVYDNAGLLRIKHDAKGTAFTYTYDDNSRIESVTAGTRESTFMYEPGSDNRSSASAGSITTTFGYDDAGRLKDRADAIDGRTFTTHFDYDKLDNLRVVQYPSGRRIVYSYNNANQIIRVTEEASGTDYARDFEYHPSGAILSYRAGNGIVHRTSYDPDRYWPTSIDGGELHLTYGEYDGVGNVKFIGDARPGMSQIFGYDVLDRLASANGPYGSSSYDYDVHGNRRTSGGSTYTYKPGKLWLIEQNGHSFDYDPNGNLITALNATYTYTPDNQLESAAVPGVTAQYVYDADGWRVKKTAGANVSYHLRGAHGELLTDMPVAGSVTTMADYVYAGSRLLAVIRHPAH